MIRKLLAKLHKKYYDSKISSKILTFYCAVLFFTILLSAIIYRNIYKHNLSEKVSEVSVQTLYSISSNIRSIVENAKNLSKVIISSEEIQESLATIVEKSYTTINPDAQLAINAQISTYIEAFPFISSIYVFDNNSTRYGFDRFQLKSLQVMHINEADWY